MQVIASMYRGAYGSSAYKSERCLCTGQFGTRRTQRIADPIDETQFAFICPNAVPGRAPGVDAPTRVRVYLLWRRIVLGPNDGTTDLLASLDYLSIYEALEKRVITMILESSKSDQFSR